MSANTNVPAVEKAMSILLLMSSSPKVYWGVSSIASELSLNKSTVHSILNTMINFGFIEKNTITDKYSLGSAFFSIKASYFENNPIRESFHDVVSKIHHECPECINCFILKSTKAYIIDSFSSGLNYSLRVEMPVNTSISPLYSSAGKILLSSLNDIEIEKIYYAEQVSYSNKEVSNLSEFLAQIHNSQLVSYAINNAEYEPGICSVAAPIYNSTRKIVAAVNIVVPEARFSDQEEHYIAFIQKIAADISCQLGFQPVSED